MTPGPAAPAPRTTRVLPDADAAAEAAALHVAALLNAAPLDRPLVLAVSGGSSPVPLYVRLGGFDLPWPRLHVAWVDERCVPPDHPDANAALVRDTLLATAPVEPGFLHLPPTTLGTPAEAAAAYDADLRALLGDGGGFTVAVMGVGADGHTASLFPGQPVAHPGRLAVHTVAPPSSPVPDRITCTLGLLGRTDHVVFFVTGEGKAAVVKDALAEPPPCPALPAACVTGRASHVWFLDEDAAGLLQPQRR